MLININRYWLMVIVNFGIIRNFISLSSIYRKVFSIWSKKNVYTVIVIDKNFLLSKNKRVDKKTEVPLIAT